MRATTGCGVRPRSTIGFAIALVVTFAAWYAMRADSRSYDDHQRDPPGAISSVVAFLTVTRKDRIEGAAAQPELA